MSIKGQVYIFTLREMEHYLPYLRLALKEAGLWLLGDGERALDLWRGQTVHLRQVPTFLEGEEVEQEAFWSSLSEARHCCFLWLGPKAAELERAVDVDENLSIKCKALSSLTWREGALLASFKKIDTYRDARGLDRIKWGLACRKEGRVELV